LTFGREIVVTGASGFIARHFMRAARDRGLTVTGLTRKVGPGLGRTAEDRVVGVAHYADYVQSSGAVLVHLGEPAHIPAVDKMGMAHCAAVREQARALLARGYRRAVYASSVTVYGDDSDVPHLPTDPPIAGRKLYADAKIEVEALFTDSAAGVVARITNVYGPGMAAINIFSDILSQLGHDGPVAIQETTPIREYLWVEDLAQALMAMALGESRGTYNLSTERPVACGELARLILDLAGQKERKITAQRPPRKSVLRLDINDTTSDFRWTPSTSLECGIAKLLKLFAHDAASNRGFHG